MLPTVHGLPARGVESELFCLLPTGAPTRGRRTPCSLRRVRGRRLLPAVCPLRGAVYGGGPPRPKGLQGPWASANPSCRSHVCERRRTGQRRRRGAPQCYVLRFRGCQMAYIFPVPGTSTGPEASPLSLIHGDAGSIAAGDIRGVGGMELAVEYGCRKLSTTYLPLV